MAATGSIFSYSDLYRLYNVAQSTNLVVVKQLIIAQLRDYFSQDTFYHYERDVFGFPKTPDHTDLPQDAGLNDNSTTRLYIGEYYRNQGIYYPALLVKSGSVKYTPLSINRERESVMYEEIFVTDGYGHKKVFKTPKFFVFAGYWTGEVIVEIISRGIRSRDDLVDLTMLLFSDIRHREMEEAGVIITSVSASSPTESDDRNDKLFKQTVTLSIQSQWRREIPVLNSIDLIHFCIDFVNDVNADPLVVAPNIEIKTEINLLDAINGL